MDDEAEPRRRRSEVRQRTRHLPTVRTDDAEHAAIMAVFAASGFRSFGAFARAAWLANRATSAEVDHALIGRVLAAVGSVGGNVNQLARAYNMHGELPADMAALVAAVTDMRAVLMEALGRGD